ncbi:hypothetical protein CY34DRAFT_17691 [Suillus luteus UH-Slu-Lm8-n1]|uniref:C2H2-type domain-containing protein n=1 Tax=Suillus luteus UH-Slu-Lm8-n1 TaxID=930992 RepID=A0A0C9ZAI9_9AGAM|nr:hypothetical protein CY34DRAFT_17691 [Suillus luteus UH-Slu-Lm8-n1]
MPATRRKSTPVECDICSKVICRRGDLPRHMQTHATNKEDLKLLCPISGCGHRTLQKSNLQTHIARHTGELKNCPDCTFANADPSQITEHRKEVHGHMPKPRRYFGRTASRRSAAAPYPSVRYLTPEVEIFASLYLNDLTFPEYAGFAPCGSRSLYAEASDTRLSDEFEELPVHTFTHLHPPTVPANLTTSHIDPQPQLLSGVIRPQANHSDGSQPYFRFQQLLSNEEFQSPSVAEQQIPS